MDMLLSTSSRTCLSAVAWSWYCVTIFSYRRTSYFFSLKRVIVLLRVLVIVLFLVIIIALLLALKSLWYSRGHTSKLHYHHWFRARHVHVCHHMEHPRLCVEPWRRSKELWILLEHYRRLLVELFQILCDTWRIEADACTYWTISVFLALRYVSFFLFLLIARCVRYDSLVYHFFPQVSLPSFRLPTCHCLFLTSFAVDILVIQRRASSPDEWTIWFCHWSFKKGTSSILGK